jgi:hypothetical protein
VIIELLVAQRKAKHALRDQRVRVVLDAVGVAVIGEAGGQATEQSAATLCRQGLSSLC